MFSGIKGKASQTNIKYFFGHMGLPLPDNWQKQIFRTHDGGGLLLLGDYGCTVRMTNPDRWHDPYKNPYFLKPLFRYAADSVIIDINPGLESPVDKYTSINTTTHLRDRYNIVVEDARPDNYGVIPESNHPVLLDLDTECVQVGYYDIKSLCNNIRNLARKLRFQHDRDINEDTDHQTRFYQPLRDIMQNAWPAATDNIDYSGVRAFWQECRKWKERGFLKADWVRDDGIRPALPQYDKEYKTLLRAQPPEIHAGRKAA
mgnify:CR=1 FL=1